MRKALSLILAVVMVALMIPFAAITSLAADGDVLYSMDFTEWGKKNANATAAVGDKITLPDGWDSLAEADKSKWSSVSEDGVFLGGANQGIEMTTVPATNGAHVIKISWNTTTWLHTMRFAFTADADTAASASFQSGKGYGLAKQIIYPFLSGPQSAYGGMTRPVDGYVYGGVVGWDVDAKWGAGQWKDGYTPTTEILDKNGNAADVMDMRKNLSVPANNGDVFTTYIFVGEDNIVDKVCMETGSVRYEYIAPAAEAISAHGRLAIWHTNDGGNTSVTIKSVEYISNTYGAYKLPTLSEAPAEEPANLLHHYNFSDAESLADLPYDIYDGANANVVLKNGLLCMETVEGYTTKTVHNDTTIKLDSELFPADGNYTLEYVIDGSSYFGYLFNIFNMDEEPSNGNFTLKEYFNFSYYTAENGGKDKLFASKCIATTFSGTGGTDLSADMRENAPNGDIRVQMIVENNKILGAYVSVITSEETYTMFCAYNQTAQPVAGADVGFLFRNDANYGASVGFKSITILDKPLYEVDLNEYETTVNHVVRRVDDNLVDVYDVSDVELTKGDASLRVVESENGIRFSTSFTEEDLQTLVDLVDTGAIAKVEVGTLITTTPWATAAGAVTHEALDAIAGDKTAYVEVMATLYDWYAENTFAGTISALKDGREYQAVGFIRITDSMGHVIYIYSDANTATLAGVQA